MDKEKQKLKFGRKFEHVCDGFLTTLCRVDSDYRQEAKCFNKHKVRKSKSSETMSVVGCFGDCGFGPTEAPKPREYKLVFHPPIQTILKEKDTQKWYTDMVNELATLGDDPNHLNDFGEAPLCVAAYKAQGMVVEELLQKENIKVNIKGKHGRTPLYLAAEEGHVYIVKCLLQHSDIDVNCKNAPGGATALMGASRRGHSRIVELLLQHPRCDPDLLDRDGNTALHHARTPSVKWRIHNHSFRSRSMENVLGRNRSNLCHVSPDLPPSDSVESSPGTPDIPTVANFRHHSLEEFHTMQYTPSPSKYSRRQSSSECSTRLSSSSSHSGPNACEEEEPGSSETVEAEDHVWEDNQLMRRPLLTSSRSGSPMLRARIISSPAAISTSPVPPK
eukprot:GFUD01034498.1.p1 GENE.GFUD01034498.1~~GFUD01034498.1.p1  ORF type:complete len:389 (+),score=63.87 GFUD01034498.1:152-1318(+)